MTERRFENRFACADLVRVDWVESGDGCIGGADHPYCSTEGVLEDISRVGACVQLETGIPLGTDIAITLGGERLSGHVCYCVYRDYGYFVGINFNEDTRWTSDAGRPAHLTDLSKIAAQRQEA